MAKCLSLASHIGGTQFPIRNIYPIESPTEDTSEEASQNQVIDIKQAIEDSELDYASFVEILDVFYRTNISKMEEINALFDEADWDTLRSKAHAMKGSAANICAYDLNLSARKFEEACDDAHKTKKLRRTNGYFQHWRRIYLRFSPQ